MNVKTSLNMTIRTYERGTWKWKKQTKKEKTRETERRENLEMKNSQWQKSTNVMIRK